MERQREQQQKTHLLHDSLSLLTRLEGGRGKGGGGRGKGGGGRGEEGVGRGEEGGGRREAGGERVKEGTFPHPEQVRMEGRNFHVKNVSHFLESN